MYMYVYLVGGQLHKTSFKPLISINQIYPDMEIIWLIYLDHIYIYIYICLLIPDILVPNHEPDPSINVASKSPIGHTGCSNVRHVAPNLMPASTADAHGAKAEDVTAALRNGLLGRATFGAKNAGVLGVLYRFPWVFIWVFQVCLWWHNGMDIYVYIYVCNYIHINIDIMG